ncbi:MAG: YggU family protein [Desulfosarcina sp.]|nr:YggU family protein [Desulfobacterales bacterium]
MLKDHPEGIVLSVRVQPRASKNAIKGVHGDALKITLTAPPVDGAANKACIAFLARQLKLSKSAIQIISGQTSRNKRVLLRIEPGPDFSAHREALKKKLSVHL